MRRSRHSVLIRLLTLLFLLRICLDFGAHGVLACEFPPIQGGASMVRFDAGQPGGHASMVPDHCFCHGLSVGAVVPVRGVVLTLVGHAVTPLPTAVPHTDRHPLDQPPRLAA